MRVVHSDDLTETEVSHNALLKKKVLVGKGEIENMVYFSRAVFPPGEIAGAHSHDDMTEVFFVESGEGQAEVDGRCINLPPGSCLTVEPNESHEIKNTGAEDLVLLYFGVKAE